MAGRARELARDPPPMQIRLEPHPLARPVAFLCELPAPLGELESPPWLRDLLALDAGAPLQRTEEARAAVRDLLRHGGYKPTGRGKPSSEYLVRAAGEGALSSINLAVDACNAVSLASGVPISVIDPDLARGELSIALGPPETAYVFNASGQEIRVDGLLCLFDREGPCANAVKDAQRTKTHAGTRRALSVLWGTSALPGLAEEAAGWYRELLERAGAATGDVDVVPAG